jgi:hypothetical protein
VLARFPGAALRGLLVAMLVAMPSLLLPVRTTDATEMVALLALLAGLLTFVEYYSNFPSFIEFRDAPPLNRFRFFSLFFMVLILTLISKVNFQPTNMTYLLHGLGISIGNWLDFPYSPVHLVTLMLPDNTPQHVIDSLRMAAGVTYVIAMITVAGFIYSVRVMGWPTYNGAFNVWVNLPLFDPTAGGDVVYRLQRDGRINIILGVLLPFIIPAVIKMAAGLVNPFAMENPQTLIWTMCAWAFLPASMIMRGEALLRIAGLIEEKRRRAYANAEEMQVA